MRYFAGILFIFSFFLLSSCKKNSIEKKRPSKIDIIVGKNYTDCLCQFEWDNPEFSFEGRDLYDIFPEYKVGLDTLDNSILWKLKCEKDFSTFYYFSNSEPIS